MLIEPLKSRVGKKFKLKRTTKKQHEHANFYSTGIGRGKRRGDQ